MYKEAGELCKPCWKRRWAINRAKPVSLHYWSSTIKAMTGNNFSRTTNIWSRNTIRQSITTTTMMMITRKIRIWNNKTMIRPLQLATAAVWYSRVSLTCASGWANTEWKNTLASLMRKWSSWGNTFTNSTRTAQVITIMHKILIGSIGIEELEKPLISLGLCASRAEV